MPEKSSHGATVRLVACLSCGAVLWKARTGQKYCSGRCRAKASRRHLDGRMRTDLAELQRRIEAMLATLEK